METRLSYIFVQPPHLHFVALQQYFIKLLLPLPSDLPLSQTLSSLYHGGIYRCKTIVQVSFGLFLCPLYPATCNENANVTLTSLLTNEIVTIRLLKSNVHKRHPPLREYHVQKQILCSASKAFNLHFNSRFPHPKTYDVNVEQVSQEILETFLAWVYNIDLDRAVNKSTVTARKLVDLYLFADDKGCNRLKNDIMDLLQDTIVGGQLSWDLNDISQVFGSPAVQAESCWILKKFAGHCLLYGSIEIEKFTYQQLRAFFDAYPGAETVYSALQRVHWNSRERNVRHPLKRDDGENAHTTCTYHIHDTARGECCRTRGNGHLFAAASPSPSPPLTAPNTPPYYYYN